MIKKNLWFAFQFVLFSSVMVLYVLHFVDKYQAVQIPPKRSILDSAKNEAEANLVYVNVDSLLEKYEFSRDLNKSFDLKRDRMRVDLRNKAENFQRDAAQFQEKMQKNAFLSQASAESQQEDLMQRQQDLESMQANLSDELMAEQEKLNKQLYDSILNFLKEYNQNYNYHFILSNSYGGNLLYADERLDITDTVIKVLNHRYALSVKKK
jgi:outer membrane protein